VDAYPLSLAGIPFVVGPSSLLSAADRAALARLQADSSPLPDGEQSPVTVELVTEAPWPGARGDAYADFAPAEVAATPEGRVRIMHRRYLAELDLVASRVRLQRFFPEVGLQVALRLTLNARLPVIGGLPVHAAGVVLDGHGLVFFGASGAGKSTLAATREDAVVSDELVAVVGAPWRLVSTGFYPPKGTARAEAAPLTAIVELAQGPRYVLERLSPQRALRRLLGQVLVPPSPVLWKTAIAVAGRLVREVPVYRLHWSPEDPPWTRFSESLARTGVIG
jgi:hypothetical protein